ncbi:MAG: hypothetical protein J5876_03455, partial [Lachnospiraceae bacterium]|nr:hypothetical protein [Lachnospiraceae bacterium]
ALIKPNNSFLGKVGAFLSTYNSDAYQELKLKYNTGEVITPDLVDAAFPRITVFYRNLPNDILKGTPEASVEAQVKALVNRYKVIISEIGKEFDIPASTELMPADCNAVGHDFKVWGKEGFGYIVEALKKNANRQISSIAREYIDMVRGEVRAYKRKEEAERRAREEAREYEGSSGGGFVSSMAGAYVGAKMANRGTKKSSDDKPHLRGSAGCMRNKPHNGFCFECPHRNACADSDW